MNKPEMTAIISEHLTRYGRRPFQELRSLVESKQVDVFAVKGPSGADYQIDIQFVWDDQLRGTIRVLGSIDEDPHLPLLGFLPIYVSSVTKSLILSPPGAGGNE